jgi:GDSL-like Lipase/Acylhydrolase family
MLCVLTLTLLAEESPLKEAWDYVPTARSVADKFQGQTGVVIHVGDAVTINPNYGQWARFGKGHTDEDRAMFTAFHAGENNEYDGWWLARKVHYDHHGSFTASDGLRVSQLLHGGRGLYPTLAKMLKQHQPQIVVLRIGMHDITANVKYDSYRADLEQALDMIASQGSIGILSTLPPHAGNLELGAAYNRGIREIAAERKLPLIDFEKELLARRETDWSGTLMNRNDLLPTVIQGTATPASEPTAENLRNSGYLLLGWLTVKKLTEVRQRVLLETP